MDDESLMREAIRLAWAGQGWVEPNPMVGAVLVRDGQVIGRGFHGRFGGPHAEVEALNDCRKQGHDPAGATAYVTLEPCCHYGKQPPCAKALIEAGIRRVMIGMPDPFEPVAGGGVPMLREAGIEVEIGLCRDEAEQLAEPYTKRNRAGLPWVIAKWAQTLDGKTATHTCDSKWISGEASRRRVHEIRARVDAILIGIGTAIADDPTLTARDVQVKRIARRVVVDPDLRLPSTSKLINTLDRAPLTIAVDQQLFDEQPDRLKAMVDRGVEVVGLPGYTDSVDQSKPRLALKPLLEHLSQSHQAVNVLTEGGAGLHGALLSQGLADQVLSFVAPKIVGDARALAAVTGLDCERIADSTKLSLRSVEQIGEDVLIDYRVDSPTS